MTKLRIEITLSQKEEFLVLQRTYQRPFVDLEQMYIIEDLSERSLISFTFTGIIVPPCLTNLKMPRPLQFN